ncbi:MAG: MMPL family transporter [Acidimicrobiia bacterium]
MGLGSLAVWCARRRWIVLFVWVVLGGIGIALFLKGGSFSEVREIPPGEGKAAYQLLNERFPEAAGDNADIVFEAPSGVRSPEIRAQIDRIVAETKRVPGVLIVQSPLDAPDSNQISSDGTIAFARAQFSTPGIDVPLESAQRIVDLGAKASTNGLEVAVTGPALEKALQPKPPASEAIGIAAAMLILLIAFGSIVAMGVPIATALLGLFAGLGGLALLTYVIDVPSFAPQLAAMIGLGVGIDYALFVVTRYRQELERGFLPEAAIRLALSTAGRAVVFAAATVVISLLGMFLMQVAFVRGLAVGAVFAVLLVMAASITLLPAILGFAGTSINRLRIPGFGKQRAEGHATLWYRWSRLVQRNPWPAAIASFVAMCALAYPTLSITLGFSDNGTLPKKQTSRVAYDLLSKGFGPGYNGPLIVVTAMDNPAELEAVQKLRSVLQSTPGVANVGPVFPSPRGGAALVVVTPTTSPQDNRTSELVRRLREQVIPQATAGTAIAPKVGGFTATGIDFSNYLAERLPLFIGVVLALSFLLLMVVFRSLLVPLKAVIMNVLSIAAAYGVVVLVFQEGWFASLIGVDRTGPIEPFVPMLLFAILFGLSMDYEVFLLSRVREEFERTGDNGEAVADGLATTARVITAAAAIMIAVFLAFVLDSNRVIKMFGVGLASAIFIDATIVRLMLVPATMELLGKANWWLPSWLNRILPHLDIETADVGDLNAERQLERRYDATVAMGVGAPGVDEEQ